MKFQENYPGAPLTDEPQNFDLNDHPELPMLSDILETVAELNDAERGYATFVAQATLDEDDNISATYTRSVTYNNQRIIWTDYELECASPLPDFRNDETEYVWIGGSELDILKSVKRLRDDGTVDDNNTLEEPIYHRIGTALNKHTSTPKELDAFLVKLIAMAKKSGDYRQYGDLDISMNAWHRFIPRDILPKSQIPNLSDIILSYGIQPAELGIGTRSDVLWLKDMSISKTVQVIGNYVLRGINDGEPIEVIFMDHPETITNISRVDPVIMKGIYFTSASENPLLTGIVTQSQPQSRTEWVETLQPIHDTARRYKELADKYDLTMWKAFKALQF